MKLKNKVIVITGSTRGIGLAIAKACAGEGGNVVICSRRKSAVTETCKSFIREGFNVSGLSVDVTIQSDIEKLLQHTVDTFGGVDVWINNAGLSGGYRFLDDIPDEEILKIVKVNIIGTLLACRLIIPYFIANKGGILINLGGKGSRGEAAPFLTTYAATKAAVNSITKSLAQEYKNYPVSIHSVIPGMVKTDFYKDMKVSLGLINQAKSVPYALKAFGVPIDIVGKYIAQIAAQKPGKVTGKQYSLFKGFRLMRGIGLMTWYRITGKLRNDKK